MLPYIPASKTSSLNANSGSTSSNHPKKPTTISSTTRERWDSAPSAHRLMLDEARRALSSHHVAADRVLTMPHTASSSTNNNNNSRGPSGVVGELSSLRNKPSPRVPTSSSSSSLQCAPTTSSLLQEEDDQRLYWMSREAWSREVCSQMARVEYLEHVLQPQVDQLLQAERSERSSLVSLEQTSRQDELQQSSERRKLERLLDEHWRKVSRLQAQRLHQFGENTEEEEDVRVSGRSPSPAIPSLFPEQDQASTVGESQPRPRIVYHPVGHPNKRGAAGQTLSESKRASTPRVYASEAEAILERYQQMHQERLLSQGRTATPSLPAPPLRFQPSPPPTAPGRLRSDDGANGKCTTQFDDLGLTKPSENEEATTAAAADHHAVSPMLVVAGGEADSDAPAEQQQAASAVRPPTAPVMGPNSVPPRRRSHLTMPTAGRTIPVLSLDVVMSLLNQHLYFTRQVAELEESERKDIAEDAGRDATHAHSLAQRRMHLERLEYWRAERDARRALDAKLAEIQKRLVEVEESERDGRQLLVREELSARDLYTSNEVRSFYAAEQHDLARVEGSGRSHIEAEWFLSSALDLVSHLEGIQRQLLHEEFDSFVETVLEPRQGELQALQRWSLLLRDRCIAIQRWARKLFLGLAGWRRTHRQVGESIQQMRSQKRVLAQKASLQSYQRTIQQEMDDVFQDMNHEWVAQQLVCVDEESSLRKHHETHQQWMRDALIRQCKAQIAAVFFPKIVALERQEARARAVLDVCENELRNQEIEEQALRSAKLIADVKLFLHGTEPEDRAEILTQCSDALQLLRMAAELDLDDAWSRQEQRLQREAAARLAIENEAEHTILSELYLDFTTSLGTLFSAHQCDLVTTFALSNRLSGRLRLYHEWSDGFVALAQHFIAREQVLVAYGLLQRNKEVHATLALQRLADRAVIEKNYAANVGMQYPISKIYPLFESEKQIIEERVERRHRASLAVQSFFRKFQLGLTGRRGMRAFLRLKFEEKRERWEHQQKLQQQRDDLQAVKDELAKAIAEHELCTAEAYQELYQHMAQKLEPRNRVKISESERFIRQIIKRNFEHEAYELLQREHFELLQHESYRRVELMNQWQKLVEHEWTPKAKNLLRDVSVRPMQRAWRCFKARRERRLRAIVRLTMLDSVESTARHGIELQEVTESALTDILPPLAQRYARVDYFIEVEQGVLQLALDARQPVIEQEWTERCYILWAFQLATAYRSVSEVEREERYQLQKKQFPVRTDMAQHLENERLHRVALEHERMLFLLRLVSLQEQEIRLEVVEAAEEDARRNDLLTDTWEPFQRLRVVERYFQRFSQITEFADSSIRLQVVSRDEERSRARLLLMATESVARCDAEDRGTSVGKWYTWLCDVQQSRQRSMLELQEQGDTKAILCHSRDEPVGRARVQKDATASFASLRENVCVQEEQAWRVQLAAESRQFYDGINKLKKETIHSKIILGGTRTLAAELEVSYVL